MIPVLLALCGAFVVCWVLLLSYVNRDAARRGMSPTLWTLICLFVPNLIGFILYFLLRKSLPTQCPGCGFTVNDSFRFCPRCRYALAPVCGSCGQPIRNDYACCPYLRPGDRAVRNSIGCQSGMKRVFQDLLKRAA